MDGLARSATVALLSLALFGCATQPSRIVDVEERAPPWKSPREFQLDLRQCAIATGTPAGTANNPFIECMRARGNTVRLLYSDGRIELLQPLSQSEAPAPPPQYTPPPTYSPPPTYVPPSPAYPPPQASPAPGAAPASPPRTNPIGLTPTDIRAIEHFGLAAVKAYLSCPKGEGKRNCMVLNIGKDMIHDVGPLVCAHRDFVIEFATKWHKEQYLPVTFDLAGCAGS